MKIKISQTVFVFDLDDTLYQEAEYRISGFRHIESLVKTIYRGDIRALLEAADFCKDDVLSNICNQLALSIDVKSSLLWAYRLHPPSISLDKSIRGLLDRIIKNAGTVVIHTDGRSVSQRLKLKALGLGEFPVYISEEYGDIKPGLTRLKEIELKYKLAEFVYVGDNVGKDFIGPNTLGWKTIGVMPKPNNIHGPFYRESREEMQPQLWINSLPELGGFLC